MRIVEILAALAFASVTVVCAHAASRTEFDQLVQQLQAKPSDNGLRERVIKMSLELKPAPAIPEPARAAFFEAAGITKAATDPAQQKMAVKSYQDALKFAPWWGEAYYNLAVAQELAGQFEGAKATLKFYLLTQPGEKEAREAQDRIYALNGKIKVADSKKTAPAQSAGSRSQPATTTGATDEKKALAALEGAIWLSPTFLNADACADSGCTQMTTMHHRVGYVVQSGALATLYLQWPDGQSEPPARAGRIETSDNIMKPIPLTARRVAGVINTADPSCSTATFVISDDAARISKSYSCASLPPEEFVRAY